MLRVFLHVYRCLKPGGRFVVLIGDGIVKERLVDMGAFVMDIAEASEFTVERIQSVPLLGVSRRFIKNPRLDTKKHHVVALRKTA